MTKLNETDRTDISDDSTRGCKNRTSRTPLSHVITVTGGAFSQ